MAKQAVLKMNLKGVNTMNSAYDFIIWIYTHTGNFDTIIFALPVIFMITLIYWFIRFILHKCKFGNEFKIIRKKARLNETIRLITVCWLCALLCITLAPTEFWMQLWKNIASGQNLFYGFSVNSFGEIDFMPKVLEYIVTGHLDWLFWSARTILPHLLLNILLFIPLGMAMPFIYSKASLGKIVLMGITLSLFIEFVQFFLGRQCEIDDLICNTIGAILGYILYLLIKKVFPGFIEKGKLSVQRIDYIKRKKV